MKHIFRTGALVLGVGLVLAACSSSSYGGGSAKATGQTPAASSTTTVVKSAPSSLGTILVDAQGRTLYGFANDTSGTSTCDGGCASVWPAVTVTGSPKPGAGLDATLFTTVARSDGTHQLKAGKWPLYLFTGDTKPGDVNGQGTENFFVVSPDGSLIKT